MSATNLTEAQRYALEWCAAEEGGAVRPRKTRWDARQHPRWDVLERLRQRGLIEDDILRPTDAGRAALRGDS
jgi:hypothetical protein